MTAVVWRADDIRIVMHAAVDLIEPAQMISSQQRHPTERLFHNA
jgi:hypothetical protein